MRLKAYLTAPDGTETEALVPDDMASAVEERREQLVEAAAEGDDSLLEKYLDAPALYARWPFDVAKV